MKKIAYLFICIAFITLNGLSQNRDISTHTASKKALLKQTKQPVLVHNQDIKFIKTHLLRENPHTDTSRTEFHLLLNRLSGFTTANTSISIIKYNSAINQYNQVIQINDFLTDIQMPSIFKNELINFYRKAMFCDGQNFSFDEVKATFKKMPGPYILAKTGTKPFTGNEKVTTTTHNHIDEILKEFIPNFQSLSNKKKERYLQSIKIINPWIQEFRQGINYNTTKKTYLADDELLLLLPAN